MRSDLFAVSLAGTEGNLEVKSYSSLSKRAQECIEGFVLLEWWEDVWNLYAWIVCMRLCMCCLCDEMLRFETRVTPRFLTDDTNGTSASPMWMAAGKRLWVDTLLESMIMASVLLSFSWSLFAVIQDLTSVVQLWRVSIDWWTASSVLTL